MTNNKPKNNYKGDTDKVSSYDVCQTPPHALEPLLPLLKREQRLAFYDTDNLLIWESAVGPERLIEKTLKTHSFQVYGTDLSDGYNFFEYDIADELAYIGEYIIQVTNPPWSIKYKWIQRSFELGYPFALLVPYETTAAGVFQKLAEQYHKNPYRIQVLAPERRINFKMPNLGWGITEWDESKQKMVKKGDSAQMPTIWLTWGLNVDKVYDQYIETYAVPMRKVKYNDDNTEKE